MKHIITLFLIVMSTLAPLGCAAIDGAPSAGPEINQQAGGEALQALLKAYEQYSLGGFDAKVSQEFRPDRQEFIQAVDAAATKSTARSYELFIDRVQGKDGTMTVAFKWHAKTTPLDSGDQIKASGISEFLFTFEDSVWKLMRTGGDNPFI